jgi:hypothetical protein
MMATPRPRGDSSSGMAPASDLKSNPFPVFVTLIAQCRSSTWRRTSYSSLVAGVLDDVRARFAERQRYVVAAIASDAERR